MYLYKQVIAKHRLNIALHLFIHIPQCGTPCTGLFALWRIPMLHAICQSPPDKQTRLYNGNFIIRILFKDCY